MDFKSLLQEVPARQSNYYLQIAFGCSQFGGYLVECKFPARYFFKKKKHLEGGMMTGMCSPCQHKIIVRNQSNISPPNQGICHKQAARFSWDSNFIS